MSNRGWLRTLLLFVLAFAVQTTVAEWLQILGVGPDFVVLLSFCNDVSDGRGDT